MNILIIEDEENLAYQLVKMITELEPEAKVMGIFGSIKQTIDFIQTSPDIDLMLVDIYLSDGLSFEIFEQVNPKVPLIFCTAYDQFAVKAFELESVDYLLKPIRKEDLQRALRKFGRVYKNKIIDTRLGENLRLLNEKLKSNKAYRKNFLLQKKDRLIPVGVDEISYFHSEFGMVKCITGDNRLFTLDESLDSLNEELDPALFYRVNRQYLVRKESIIDVEFCFNGRLLLNVTPPAQDMILVSKAKAGEFKDWLKNT